MQQESDQEKSWRSCFSTCGKRQRENREKPESRYEPGQVAEREEAGVNRAGHDAGERELLFPHRPLSS